MKTLAQVHTQGRCWAFDPSARQILENVTKWFMCPRKGRSSAEEKQVWGFF